MTTDKHPPTDGDTASSSRHQSDKVVILFMAANPSETVQLNLAKECHCIEDVLRQSTHHDRIGFMQEWAVGPDDLQRALLQCKPHVFHFSGHGTPKGEMMLIGPDGGALAVSQEGITELFRILRDNLRVIVLNFCNSAVQAKALNQWIDCAIGMDLPIGDEAARDFATAFYRALAENRSVQEAFELGRNRVSMENVPESKRPQLFSRPEVNPGGVFLLSADDTKDAQATVGPTRVSAEAVPQSGASRSGAATGSPVLQKAGGVPDTSEKETLVQPAQDGVRPLSQELTEPICEYSGSTDRGGVKKKWHFRISLLQVLLLIAGIGILAAVLLPALARARESARRASCQNNLKQFGTVFKMYANENGGRWPLLGLGEPPLLFSLSEVYPEYLSDLGILICPTDPKAPEPKKDLEPEALMKLRYKNSSYRYLGYAVVDETQGLALLMEVKKALREGRQLVGPIQVEKESGTGGGDELLPLKGLDDLDDNDVRYIAAATAIYQPGKSVESLIPVMIERYDGTLYHEPGGMNVLYMDGHVEFVKLGDKFPVTPKFLNKLAEIDGYSKEPLNPPGLGSQSHR